MLVCIYSEKSFLSLLKLNIMAGKNVKNKIGRMEWAVNYPVLNIGEGCSFSALRIFLH